MPLTLNGTTGIVTGNLADASVTTPKIADSAVVTVDIADGAVTTVKVADSSVTGAKLSGGQSGTAPVYGCRAWVNFAGTLDTTGASSTANTNRFIRGSGNVTSVLRNALGDYTITFTTAMPDANYAATYGGASGAGVMGRSLSSQTASAIRIVTSNTNNGFAADDANVYVAIFR